MYKCLCVNVRELKSSLSRSRLIKPLGFEDRQKVGFWGGFENCSVCLAFESVDFSRMFLMSGLGPSRQRSRVMDRQMSRGL
jgi:hypothetical protein